MSTGLKPGDVLEGRYRVKKRIGEGGMGVVYRSEHVVLHRDCAVKVLHPAEADDETMIKRFRVEAQAAANVRHRHIVEVTDFGVTPDNRPFFVMEYLEGQSLAERLDLIGKLTVRESVTILSQILNGLQTAHQRGVIHRDLKPENIFLAKEGNEETVKILDFGISKIVGGTPSRPPVPITAKHRALTQQGMVFGTPGYMAPETLFGAETVDARADLFSIAVILFEMLTGKPPFEAGDPHSTMMATASQQPPAPRKLEPTIPAAMEEVILKGLEKDREHRYQSAEAFARAVKQAAAKPEVSRRPAPKPATVTPAPGTAAIPPSGLDIDRDFLAASKQRFIQDRSFPKTESRLDPLAGIPSGKKPIRSRARFSIAFSPLTLLFFLGIGGAVYYYFVRQDPAYVVGDADPIKPIHSETPKETVIDDVSIPLEMVSISIDSEPEEPTVLWNGEIKFKRPLVVPRGENAVEVRFKSPGYREETMTIVPDKDKTITVRLEKLRRPKRR